MTFNGTHMMPYANNITITTELFSCDNATWNLNQTLSNLRNLYQSNISNLTFNISIINFKCTNTDDSYLFEQIISFTQAVSIRIQILFASVYFDYLNANNFQFDGLIIDPESLITLSSITVNNSETSNACSSAVIAQDPLCLTNLTNSICSHLSNPWNFNCSQLLVTTVTPLVNSTSQLLQGVVISTGLNSWKIGLISGLSVAFVLFLLLLSGCFYRRYRHSKQLALSRVSLYDDTRFTQKNGIPQGQAFQRVATIVQPKVRSHTATSWVRDDTATNSTRNDKSYINLKSAGPLNQVTFVDHAKVYDPAFPSDIPVKPKTTVTIPTSPPNRIGPTFLSRPVSKTSLNQLKLIPNGLHEKKFHKSNNISFNRSIPSTPKKPTTPVSKPFSNLSFIDENLTDEDAWMSILDVVNTELAILNGQDPIKTLM